MLKLYLSILIIICSFACFGQQVSTFLIQAGSQFEGISWGEDQQIYVVDFATGDVCKTDINGGLEKLGTYSGALGGAIDANGNYYFSEYNTGRVIKYDINDNSEVYCEGLVGPAGILIDEENQIMYVANYFGNSIAKIDMTSTTPTPQILASGGFINGPDGLAFSPEGDIISANFNDNSIQKITPEGEVSQFAMVQSSSNTGYIVRWNNQYIITGAYSPQIYSISLTGEVSIFAGTAEAGYKDGDFEEAQFFFPNGIALSPSQDSLIITESGEQGRIRLISELGLVNNIREEELIFRDIEIGPNPSTEFIQIHFDLATSTTIKLSLLNLEGALIDVFFNDRANSGSFDKTYLLDKGLSAGIYVLQISAGTKVYHHKIVIEN